MYIYIYRYIHIHVCIKNESYIYIFICTNIYSHGGKCYVGRQGILATLAAGMITYTCGDRITTQTIFAWSSYVSKTVESN